MNKSARPDTGGARREPSTKLRLIDVESEDTRVCDLREAEEWDFDRSRILRLVDGRQITSYDMLVEIACQKGAKGYDEIEVYEAPRFMLFSGG